MKHANMKHANAKHFFMSAAVLLLACGEARAQQQQVAFSQIQARVSAPAAGGGVAVAPKSANGAPMKPAPADDTVIQVALLLDTSNSMDGLIDQAKAQLWRIVNELVKAKKKDAYAKLQVALYEYGNTRLPAEGGYIRQVLPFSEDLDKISEALFALSTSGGDEYCGQVTFEAVRDLRWNSSRNTLKVIYIAGNEEYTQGPVHYRKSASAASQKQVIINTIHCGTFDDGTRGEWNLGARSAGGVYAHIDQNQKPVSIDAPQDDELIALNAKLNATYIAYGRQGADYSARQSAQDANASSVSKSVMARRAVSKAGRLYKNSSWDLVDAVEQQQVDLSKVKQSELPEALKGKTTAEIEAYVAANQKEREAVQQRITVLQREREAYVTAKTAEMAKQGENTLDDVIIATLRKQAESKGYTFSEM